MGRNVLADIGGTGERNKLIERGDLLGKSYYLDVLCRMRENHMKRMSS